MTSGWAPAVDRVQARKKPVASAGRKPWALPVSGLKAQASGLDLGPELQDTEVTCRRLRVPARPFSDQPREPRRSNFARGQPSSSLWPSSQPALPTLMYKRQWVLTQVSPL